MRRVAWNIYFLACALGVCSCCHGSCRLHTADTSPYAFVVRARLSAILLGRLERFFLLCPENNKCQFSAGSASSSFDRTPSTAQRVQDLAKQPVHATKSILQDHEKSLTSAEQSVNKALALLNKTTAELEAQQERETAKGARAAAIRERRAQEMEEVKSKARQAGEREAEVEARTGR